MTDSYLPPLDSFGDEYPMLREVITRSYKASEEFGDPVVEVTRKERDDIYAEMDEWAKTHGTDLETNPHRYAGYGAIRIEVVDE